ncbi:MAG: EamA family transporter RarD [Planctomycetes bacterium]|nr:EamA family transporter RarD [Planctomycetota bacterium]
MEPSDKRESLAGLLAVVASFVLWGALPIYWKQLAGVPAMVIVAHRTCWTAAFSLLVVVLCRRGPRLVAAIRRPGVTGRLVLTGGLVLVNWLTYIWGVNHGHVLDTSMGYYINPLVNILLGRFILGEQLRPLQWLAVALAAAGVAALVIAQGVFPWIALVLAVSFALYALVRKTAPVDAMEGLTVETGVVVIPAIALASLSGGGLAAADGWTWVLLAGTGVITGIPLLLFAYGVRRVRLSTAGFCQYITPSCLFLLGVLAYGEPLTATGAVSFGLIWTALAVYSADSLRRRRPAAA